MVCFDIFYPKVQVGSLLKRLSLLSICLKALLYIHVSGLVVQAARVDTRDFYGSCGLHERYFVHLL